MPVTCIMSCVTMRDDIIYRVSVDTDTFTIKVECLGTNWLDKTLEGSYDSFQALPDVLKDALVLLSMLVPSMCDTLDGVGKRLEANIYWVYL